MQDAGSAEQFRKVDLQYVKAAAQAAQQAGARQFSLCSAQGANANTWASDLAFAHGLLYKKTKGQVTFPLLCLMMHQLVRLIAVHDIAPGLWQHFHRTPSDVSCTTFWLTCTLHLEGLHCW